MSRILFITSKPYYPWEGACHRTRHTLEALSALGHTVDLLAVPAGHFPDIADVSVLRVPRLPFCRRLPDGPSVRRFALDLLMLFKAVFLAGGSSYTLIHGIDDGGVIAWIAARLTKTPCVFERHTAPTRENVKGPRRVWLGFCRFFERRALKHADAVIGNDASIADALDAFGRRSRACVIPDIPAVTEDVSVPAQNLARIRFKPSADHKLAVCVGSYTRFQGLDLFFNAIPYVLKANPLVRFVVVGGSEHEIQRMRKALALAEVEEAVTFTGRIPPGELAALLSIADALVSPRRAGASAPIKVLDYLYSGAPVVATNTAANRAVLSSENALIVQAEPEKLPEALANGILRLCNEPQLGAKLGRCGHETLARENRTPEAFRNALRRCYDYAASRP